MIERTQQDIINNRNRVEREYLCDVEELQNNLYRGLGVPRHLLE